MPAVKVDDALVTANATRLARRLGELVNGAGSRVAIYCGNGLEFVVARAAIAQIGAVAVPINRALVPAEVEYILEHSGAKVLLVEKESDAADLKTDDACVVPVNVHAHTQAQTEDPDAHRRRVGATLLYTSGTTGLPKGCLRAEPRELARAEELIDTYSITNNDVQLIACPLAHSAPGIFLRAGRMVGAATYVMRKFRAEDFLAAVEQTRATLFFLVPTQYVRLLALPASVRESYNVSSVRAALVAGAPISLAIKRRIIDWLGPELLWEFYGSSETGTVTVLRPEEQLMGEGCVGKPLPNVELQLIDGEIFVRSPTVMTGYIDDQGDQKNGFISVGDLGTVDGTGYLTLVDRKHDTIISGGLNVYPAEVERALARHPAVTAVVAFGVEDASWGQIVAAAISVNAVVSPTELREFLRGRIAGYKVPKAIAIIDRTELPIGASGKPLRRAARELFAGNRLIFWG